MDTVRQVSETADLIARPSIASHKGGYPIWAAGAKTPSWKVPSSSGQLPVPVALNAAFSTLFPDIIHDAAGKVNTFLKKEGRKSL